MPAFRSFDGEPIEYVRLKGGRTSLVFLHPLGFDWTYWRRQLDYFSKSFDVVALTLRGHGRKRTRLKAIDIDDHVKDIAAMLRHLRIANPVIIGASIGGVIAASVPFRVKKIICLNAPLKGTRSLKAYIRISALLLGWLARFDFFSRGVMVDFSMAGNTNNVWLFLKSLLKYNSFGIWLNYRSLHRPGRLRESVKIASQGDEVLNGWKYDYLISGNHNCAISNSREVNSLIKTLIK